MSSKEYGYRNCTTTLGKNTRLTGTISYTTSLQIEGYFKGIIDSTGFLGVGDNADVRADINADSAAIAGKISGDIHVQKKLELFSSSTVKGNIKANQIRFQDGLELIGECEMLQEPGSVDIFSAATDKLKSNLSNV